MNEIINTSIISDFINENNLTELEFCLLSRITFREYKMVMNNNVEVNMKVMLKIADLLNVSLDKLININYAQ